MCESMKEFIWEGLLALHPQKQFEEANNMCEAMKEFIWEHYGDEIMKEKQQLFKEFGLYITLEIK